MNEEFLNVSCEEWRAVADTSPEQMEVVMEMMIEAEEDICDDVEITLH